MVHLTLPTPFGYVHDGHDHAGAVVVAVVAAAGVALLGRGASHSSQMVRAAGLTYVQEAHVHVDMVCRGEKRVDCTSDADTSAARLHTQYGCWHECVKDDHARCMLYAVLGTMCSAGESRCLIGCSCG